MRKRRTSSDQANSITQVDTNLPAPQGDLLLGGVIQANSNFSMPEPTLAYLDPSIASWQGATDRLNTTSSIEHSQQPPATDIDFNPLNFDPDKFQSLDADVIRDLEYDMQESNYSDTLLWDTADLSAFNVTFPSPWFSFPAQTLQSATRRSRSPRQAIPDERFDRVRYCWPAKKADTRSYQTWNEVVAHLEDNVFSQSSIEPLINHDSSSKWKFDANCRQRVMSTLGVAERNDQPATNDNVDQGLLAQPPVLSTRRQRTRFPSINTLDFSLDLFFEQFHKFVPFIHVATFDARKTPDVLLVALCMLGFIMIKSPSAKQFVSEHGMVRIYQSRYKDHYPGTDYTLLGSYCSLSPRAQINHGSDRGTIVTIYRSKLLPLHNAGHHYCMSSTRGRVSKFD